MTKRDVLGLALKVLGVPVSVYWLLVVLGQVSALILAPERSPFGSMVVFAVLFYVSLVAAALAFGFGLLRWGDGIARWAVRRDKLVFVVDRVDFERTVLTLGMKIVGVVCLVGGVSGLLKGLVLLAGVMIGESEVHFAYSSPFKSAITLLIGGYLFFGGKVLLRMAIRSGSVPTDIWRTEDAPGDPAQTASVGADGWDRRLFVTALRIVGLCYLVLYGPWLIRLIATTVIGIFPGMAHLLRRGLDAGEALSALLFAAAAVYFITGAKHLTRYVFRPRRDGAVLPTEEDIHHDEA